MKVSVRRLADIGTNQCAGLGASLHHILEEGLASKVEGILNNQFFRNTGIETHLLQLLQCSLLGGIGHPVEIPNALSHLDTQTLQVGQTLLLVDNGSEGFSFSDIDERRNIKRYVRIYIIEFYGETNSLESNHVVVVLHHDVIGGVHKEQPRVRIFKLIEESKTLGINTVATKIQTIILSHPFGGETY